MLLQELIYEFVSGLPVEHSWHRDSGGSNAQEILVQTKNMACVFFESWGYYAMPNRIAQPEFIYVLAKLFALQSIEIRSRLEQALFAAGIPLPTIRSKEKWDCSFFRSLSCRMRVSATKLNS